MSPPRCITMLLVACATAACGSVPLRLESTPGTVATTLSAADYPGLAIAKAGFDDRSSDAAWESGDEVVFALRLRKGDEVHRWLLRLSVLCGQQVVKLLSEGQPTGPGIWDEQTWSYSLTHNGERKELTASSLRLPVTVTVSDENGTKLTSSLVKLPVQLLGSGILPAIDSSIALFARSNTEADTLPFREESVRPIVNATIAMMALLNVVQMDDALAEYFWQVVEKPSLWSVITGMGAHATLSMPFEKSVPTTALPPHLPTTQRAYVVPLQIDVNGSPALLVDIVAIDAARPYALCGGMVAAVARHPSKPDVTFELQLLSARCGKP